MLREILNYATGARKHMKAGEDTNREEILRKRLLIKDLLLTTAKAAVSCCHNNKNAGTSLK